MEQSTQCSIPVLVQDRAVDRRPASQRSSPLRMAPMGFVMATVWVYGWLLGGGGSVRLVDAQVQSPPSAAPPPVIYITIPLPIQGDVDQRVRAQLERHLGGLPTSADRPLCVLEFVGGPDNRGQGSQFERALALARFLASERMSRLRTVAFLPDGLQGHAVLVALACEELAVSEQAVFGPAGESGELIDAAMREAYRAVADRRRTVPPAVALGLLDPQVDVFRVELLNGAVRYITGEELHQLRAEEGVRKEETLSARGDTLKLTGRDMRLKFGFAAHLVANRRELAGELKVPPESFRDSVTLDESWKVVRVDFRGRVHAEPVTRTIRMIQDRIQQGDPLLLIVNLDSPGGSPADSLRLADFLANVNPQQVRTCAFLAGPVRGDAALIAMGCDELVVSDGSFLGGPGERNLSSRELSDIRRPIQALGKAKQRDWSIWYAFVNPKAQVFRCRRQGTGEERYFTQEERAEQADPDAWQIGEPIAIAEGLSSQELVGLRLARWRVERVEQVPGLFGVTGETELLQPGWFVTRLESLAAQAWFSSTVLFVAFLALIIEASTPGVGLPGFVSALCFILFFWAQFLNGTAGWLEVSMFVGGLVFLIIELFVLPGFGVFGIGGALMMVFALILASQTFVIPQNGYQLQQMPRSIYGVATALSGIIVGLIVMRKYLHRMSWFRNLALPPPKEIVGDVDSREQLADYRPLLNKVGIATTLLVPGGKAQFGDQLVDVITEGDMVGPGTRVRVVDVQGNRIVVQPIRDIKGS